MPNVLAKMKQSMASLFPNVARGNFVNFLEAFNTRSLVSVGKTFMRGRDNVIRVTRSFILNYRSHKRESYHKKAEMRLFASKVSKLKIDLVNGERKLYKDNEKVSTLPLNEAMSPLAKPS